MLKTAALLACACVLIETSDPSVEAARHVPDALQGRWLLEDISRGGVIDFLESVLEIMPDGTYGGFGGCNNFTGVFELDGAVIRFGMPASTRKMCSPAVMDQERKFLHALQSGLTWAIDDTGKLEMTTPDHGARLLLVAHPR